MRDERHIAFGLRTSPLELVVGPRALSQHPCDSSEDSQDHSCDCRHDTCPNLFLESLGQLAVEAGMKVAWFALEDLGALVRRHQADDTVTRTVARILHSEMVVVDLSRPRDYPDVTACG